MKQQKVNNIKLLVENEQDLYTPFSPDDEFREPVKTYLRSKVVGHGFKQQVKLTVISSSPLDEIKFKSAVVHWLINEKATLDLNVKHSIYLTSGMFFIGGLTVLLVSMLKQFIEPLTYAIILIIGTAVLGKGVQIWYEQVPSTKASKWLTQQIEKTSTIEFVYGDSSSEEEAL